MSNLVPLQTTAETPLLNSPGGNGTSGDMETRVAQLEKDMSEVKSDLKKLMVDVAKMQGEISRLPGYPGLITLCGTMVALVGLAVKFL